MAQILVIEDEQELRLRILKTLKLEGFDTISAENGRIGVDLAKKHVPDLIICDIRMPELSGYGVLTKIRSDPVTTTIPFIFLTAQKTKKAFRQGMQLGADDYFTKPLEVDDLISTIHARLERQAVLSEHASKQMEDLRLNLSHVLPHELRTPLTAIMGFSQLLTTFGPEMLPGPEEIIEIGQDIYESACRLHRLIEHYLLYASLKLLKYDHERKQLWRRDVEKVETKECIISWAAQKAKEAKRQGDLVLELEKATLWISKKNLQKIVIELIDNAMKFSEEGTPVRVITHVRDKQFILSITDQGRGMTREQIADIGAYMQFERKYYEQQGSGLGLIIVRMLAQLYSGELNIESVPDHGTIVTITFKQQRGKFL